MDTLGDGNCAFNAFALGLYHFYQRQKEMFYFPQVFVDRALEHNTDWQTLDDIKNWLNTTTDLTAMQKMLAPILRYLSISYLRENFSESCLDGSFYNAYLNPQADNLFKHFYFIKQKFELVTSGEMTTDDLQIWWDDKGREAYFKEMEQNAEGASDYKRWGSQAELQVLAIIFKLGLEFSHNGEKSKLGFPHGYVDHNAADIPAAFDDNCISLLRKRNVIARQFGLFSFERHYAITIEPVPHYQVLIAKLKQYKGRKLPTDEWLEVIAEEERELTKQSLHLHAAINDGCALSDKGNHHNMLRNEDIEQIVQRISPLNPDVLAYLNNKYIHQQPLMQLTLSAGHWSYAADKRKEIKNAPKPIMPNAQSVRSSGVKPSLHGTIYQLVLLMLFLRRGFDSGLSFELTTEMDEAYKFDDVVMICKDESELTYHFLQAKHRQNDDNLLTPASLLDESDGDHSLLKYFTSFRKIQKTKKYYDKKIGNSHTISKSEIGNVILYTNAAIDTTENAKNILDLKGLLVPATTINNLIEQKGQSEQNQYQFDLKQQKDKLKPLYEVLRKASRLNQLAELLAAYVFDKKKFELNQELLKHYQVALANEVFDCAKSGFKEDFIKGKSKNCNTKKLHDLFKEKLKLKFKLLDKFDTYWAEMENGKINLDFSKEFGKQRAQIVDNPEISDAEKAATTLAKGLGDKIFIKLNKGGKGLKGQIGNLAGHVFVTTDNNKVYKFSSNFISGHGLHKNLNALRESFIKKLPGDKSNKLDFMQSLRYEVNEYEACEDGELNCQKLPEEFDVDEVSNSEIELFLQHFILAVNQPHVDKLYRIVQDEIGCDFNLLHGELITSYFEKKILDWFKKKKGSFLNESDASELFAEINMLLSHYALLGPTIAYGKQVEQAKIQFKANVDIESLQKSKTPVQCILAKNSTWLSAIHLYTSLKARPEFQTQDAFIFLKANMATYLKDQLANAFEKSKLLIIEVDEILHASHFNQFLENIQKGLNADASSTKKIWFIIKKPEHKLLLSQFFKYDETVETSDAFDDFDDDTKKRFLGKECNIRFLKHEGNYCRTLGGITDSDSIKAIPEEALQLIIDSDLNDKNLDCPISMDPMSDFDRECYVQRKFKRSVTLNLNILTDDDARDIFIIITNQGDDEVKPKSKKCLLSSSLQEFIAHCEELRGSDKEGKRKLEEYKLKKICLYQTSKIQMHDEPDALKKLFPDRNIHILKQNEKSLIWKASLGKLDLLKPYILLNNANHINEERFQKMTCSIIAAEPGMGKSTVIDHLIEDSFKTNPNQLLLKIDLKKHISQLKQRHTASSEAAIAFIVEIFSLTPFAAYILQSSPSDLHVYFDGFDEIETREQETVCSLLQRLKKSLVSITIATRRHKTLQLENALETIAYELKSVELNEQIGYLVQFWTSRDITTKDKVENFATLVINQFSSAMNDKENAFMGIPLQLRLIAEAFEDSCKSFCELDEFEPNISATFNLTELYQTIIDKKLNIYFRDKLSVASHLSPDLIDSLRHDLLEKHQELAFSIIFPSNTLIKQFFTCKYFSSNELNRLALVEVKETDITFLHRTIGEYLVALKLFNLLKCLDDNDFKLLQLLLMQILFLDRSRVVYKFLIDLVEATDDLRVKQRFDHIYQQKVKIDEAEKTSLSISLIASRLAQRTFDADANVDTDDIENGSEDITSKINKKIQALAVRKIDPDDITDLYELALENELSIETLRDILVAIYNATKKKHYMIIIKEATFTSLDKLALKYIAKAYFPKKDCQFFSMTLLEQFSDIYITKSPPVTKRGTKMDLSVAKNAQERFKKYLFELQKLQEILDNNEDKTSHCFESLDPVDLIYLYISFQENKKTLTKSQIKILKGNYDTLKENEFYRSLLLMLPNNQVNTLRKWMRNKNDLRLLESLKEQFPSIDYDIAHDDQAFQSIEPSSLHYLLNSNNLFTESQINSFMAHVDSKGFNWSSEYEALFLKISSENLNQVKAFAIRVNKISLLLKLKKLFPIITLSKGELKEIFSRRDNDFFWLERDGVKLLLEYKAFHVDLLASLCGKIKESGSINGYHTTYCQKVIDNFIRPILQNGIPSSADRLAFLCCVYEFFQFSSKHIFETMLSFDLYENLLDMLSQCLDDYAFDNDILRYLTNLLLHFVKGTANYKDEVSEIENADFYLFRTTTGLMVIDPASDFHYSIHLHHLENVFNAINFVINEPGKVLKFDKCSEKRKKIIDGSLGYYFLKNRRMKKLCDRDSVVNIMSDSATKDKGTGYMLAVAQGRMHDAMQIKRNKSQKEIVFIPAENRYCFFSEASRKTDDTEAEHSMIKCGKY